MRIITLLILALSTVAQAAPIFHSRPLTYNKLFLDPASWTATDDQARETWRLVSDYFAPFDIDVTTEYPGVRGNVAWVILGGQSVNGEGGTSGIGNFGAGITNLPFAKSLASYVYADAMHNDPDLVARATAHEVGHDLGLYHQSIFDGVNKIAEYSEGDGVSVPIMGDVLEHLDEPAVWWVGTNSQRQTQDDYAQIGAVTGYAVPTPESFPLVLAGCFFLMRRSSRHHQVRPSSHGTSRTPSTRITTGHARRHAPSESVALTYADVACSKSPHWSVREPVTSHRFMGCTILPLFHRLFIRPSIAFLSGGSN